MTPQATAAHRRPEFQGLGLLATRYREGLLKTGVDLLWLGRGPLDVSLIQTNHAVYIGCRSRRRSHPRPMR
jgi:hypothetical protein